MFLTSMNVVTEMLWGSGAAKEGEEERESHGREFRRVVAEMTGQLAKPNISDLYPGVARFDLQGIEKTVKGCAERFDGIFEKVIEQRMKMGGIGVGEEREKDFLEVLLKMKDEYEEVGDDGKSKVSFSATHLKALLMDMVVEGTDATSNTVEFAVAEILNKPEVLRNVQEELDTVVGKESIVEEHHIHKLPYLQAVMKETLHLHTVLPLLVPLIVLANPVLLEATPSQRALAFSSKIWAIHRDASMWANPLEFDPERFLNSKFDFSGNNFSYLPFGSSRRSCAGIAMAERMVLFSLASILLSFDWKLPQGEKLDLEEKFGIALTKGVPLTVIPEPKLSNPSLYE